MREQKHNVNVQCIRLQAIKLLHKKKEDMTLKGFNL